MKHKKDAWQRLLGGPLVFFGIIGAVLGLFFCLILTLSVIARFNESAPTIIFAGAVVVGMGLIYRSYRKNQYWSGK